MYRIYTDGSCDNNREPKIGAHAFVVVFKEECIKQYVGVNTNSTNNKEELQAVIEAIRWVVREKHHHENKVIILTDSQYVRNGYNDWLPGWARRDFARIKNPEMWKTLWDLKLDNPKIVVEWVRGHNGDQWNEMADKLANNKRKKCLAKLPK